MARRLAPRRRRTRIVLLVLLPLLILTAWGATAAVLARDHLLQARDGLTGLGGSGALDQPAVELAVAAAREDARRARDLLAQPGPALLARVPVLGRSLAAERSAAAAASALLDAASRLLPVIAEVGGQPGSPDLRALARLRTELLDAAQDVRGPLVDLRTTPLGLTPGPVRRAVLEARTRTDGAEDLLARAADGVGALSGILGAEGPRSVLVAVMNNAELRGAGGYASSIAVLRTDRGTVTIGAFQDTNDFTARPKQAVRVPAPPDFTRRYGRFLADSTLWKNVLMSPDVPASAQVACNVAKVAPGVACDAVLLLDVPALARLATLTGPVRLPSGELLEGDELLRGLLVDAYEGVQENKEQQARRAGLRAAADRALADLVARPLGGLEATKVLVEAARGRHLAVWSARPAEQSALVRAGVAGSADPAGDDLNLVAVNQLSAAKLDYYMRREVGVSAVVGRRRATVTQRVRLELEMPAGLTEYVTGVYDERFFGLLELAVARDAEVFSVRRDGVAVEHTLVPDTGSQRVVFNAVVDNHSSAQWEVVYAVPVRDGAYRLELLPQPLARDARLELDVRAADGLRLEGGRVTVNGDYTRARSVRVRLAD